MMDFLFGQKKTTGTPNIHSDNIGSAQRIELRQEARLAAGF